MDREPLAVDSSPSAASDGVLDVLDLPQIYTKPSAAALLHALQLLKTKSRSWNLSAITAAGLKKNDPETRAPSMKRVNPEGVPQYLTSIISSSLAWIEDDDEKEQIWDAASARLSERSGRTAQGGFTRTFAVPTLGPTNSHGDILAHGVKDTSNIDPGNAHEMEISLHEPAMTADNLGLKTWAASYVMARKWPALLGKLPALSACVPLSGGQATMLELGAGTGLVGIAAACVLGVDLLLTDLPDIAPNLARNLSLNATAIEASGGIAKAAVLDWSKPAQIGGVRSEAAPLPAQEDSQSDLRGSALVVVAADPLYSPEHPALLVNAVEYHLSKSQEAVVIIALPLREAYAQERADLRRRLDGIGLEVMAEEHDIGYDDWGDDDEPTEVPCITIIWRRR